MILDLIRDDDPALAFNYGQLFVDGTFFCQTLEDPDHRLEDGGEKVKDVTSIPRGRYRVVLSKSQRFGKVMPEVLDVPGFTGVRLHGGNTEADTSGCPLLGAVRTKTGIANCAGVNARLINLLQAAAKRFEDVWLEVT